MSEQRYYARADLAQGEVGAIHLANVDQHPVVELRFSTRFGDPRFLPHPGHPSEADMVLVDGTERYYWVEYTAPLRPRPDLRRVHGHDLRRQAIRVITTDDGRRYAFLARPDIPREVTEAIPAGRRGTRSPLGKPRSSQPSPGAAQVG